MRRWFIVFLDGIFSKALMAGSKLFITGDFDLPAYARTTLYRTFEVEHIQQLRTREMLIEALRGSVYYLIGGPEYVDAEILDAAPTLRGLVVLGTGTPSFVDLTAARTRGITVRNTPGLNANAVAEFAVGMLVAVNAGVFGSAEGLHLGSEWSQTSRNDLDGCRIGLVGLGAIGALIARKLRALAPGCGLFYWSRYPKPPVEEATGARKLELPDLFARCDLCSIQVTYHPKETHHLIDDRVLVACRRELKVLHFCNPDIIDPGALLSALQENRLAFAYMDGYYREWINNRGSQHDPEGLLSLGVNKFVATSHIAARSHQALAASLLQAAEHFIQWETAGGPLTP